MSWSLDWFAAAQIARAGGYVRRVAWTDQWLTKSGAFFWIVDATGAHVVRATEITEDDLRARDWTDEAFTADPCAATPAYNTVPPVYGAWDSGPQFLPPPAPGFPEEA